MRTGAESVPRPTEPSSATYSGTEKDWLILTDPGLPLTATYESAQAVDYITVNVKGMAPGPTPDSRTVEICLTIDGATCHGDIRAFVMDTTQSAKTIGNAVAIDTWGDTLWTYDVSSRLTKTFGVMIRPAAPGASISVQAVTLDAFFSEVAGMPTAFVARAGTGDGPVIAILAEMDALPGMSQEAVPDRAPIAYKSAGVDLDTYEETMAQLPPLLRRTFTPRVLDWPGGFAGLFR